MRASRTITLGDLTLHDVPSVVEETGLRRRAVERLLRDGDLPFVWHGGRRLVADSHVHALRERLARRRPPIDEGRRFRPPARDLGDLANGGNGDPS